MVPRKPLWAVGLACLQAFALACAVPDVLGGALGNRVANIVATPQVFQIDSTPTPVPAGLSTAALVRARGVLRVGIRFDAPPLASVNGQGELVGFDVELAQEMARRWLGKATAVEFIQVTSSSAPRLAAQREVDLALGGMVRTRAAELQADFSQTYFEDGQALLARKDNFSDFRSLARQRVTWIDADTTLALRDAQNAAGVTVTLRPAASYNAAIGQLKSGDTDAVAGRLRRLRTAAQADSTLQLLAVLQREPTAVLLPPNDSDWADLVNLTLSAVVADGTYNRIHKKWFGVDGNPPRPLGDPVQVNISALTDTLQRRDTVGRMRANGRVTVGFNALADPLATLSRNLPAGFEIDLVREMAKRWFGKPEQAAFSALPADQLAAALRQGQVDMVVGGIANTQANEFNMDMSVPVFQNGVGFLVLKATRITETTRLNGRPVGLLGISPPQLAPLKAARAATFNDVSMPDIASAAAALRARQVDAVVGDRVALFAFDRTTQDTIMLRTQWTELPISFGLPTNDSTMSDLVNLTLQEMRDDGTYAQIYRRWFEEVPMYLPDRWPGESNARLILAP